MLIFFCFSLIEKGVIWALEYSLGPQLWGLGAGSQPPLDRPLDRRVMSVMKNIDEKTDLDLLYCAVFFDLHLVSFPRHCLNLQLHFPATIIVTIQLLSNRCQHNYQSMYIQWSLSYYATWRKVYSLYPVE